MKFYIILIFTLAVALSGCKNPCKDVDCQHGVCDEGVCTCEAGWDKDANGQCSIQDKCSNVSCGHGTCNNGVCTCEAGWDKDANGNCTVQDKCYGVSCGEHGNCDPDDGKCVCDAGYEGDSCSVVSRLKFLKNGVLAPYTANETGSQSGVSTYTFSISPSFSAIDEVLISNAWGAFVNPVRAKINGKTLTIPKQVPDADGYAIEGSGTMEGNVITVVYGVTFPNNVTDLVNGTWTKQ